MSMLKLEVFETAGRVSSSTVVTDLGAMEEARLASYEQGYTAGWDDASASRADDQSRIRADLARNLQTLSFTYHEARMHVLRAIEPLLLEMVGRLLPEMAREALAPVVLETLMPLAEQMADAPVSLVLNPAARPAVEALLEQATGLPLHLTEEPTLGEGQVYLRLGDCETRIDLDRATAEITAAVRGFFGLSEKDASDG
ncbi:MAG: flagellar biosynthesis protein [Alphaproteobacteria bacterium]|nr:flagellar biosynthesis protein [Alphaproteobacteria bacterium]